MPYAYLQGGSSVEITVGKAFITPSRVVQADEVDYYDRPAGTVIQEPTLHMPPAPTSYGPADLVRYGIQQFAEVAGPSEGQVLASRTLAVTAGVISAQATYAPMALADAQAQQFAALQTEYDYRRQSPMTWDFGAIGAQDGTGADKGAAGSQQIDVSDPSAKVLLTGQAEAAAYIQAGQPSALVPLITVSGLWVQTTAAQAEQVLFTGDGTQMSVVVRERAMTVHFTALLVQIKAATSTSVCLAIDLTAGWPA